MAKQVEHRIEKDLVEIAHCYPPELLVAQLNDVARIAFNIRLALNGCPPTSRSICDIGGGVGLFSVGCSALGMSVLLIDDFADPVNKKLGDQVLDIHKRFGVRVLSRDVIGQGLDDLDESFDVVTSFDSMEHWHHSPRRLFGRISNSLLRQGGRFVLGVPNCVNLRKRVTVPFGVGKWSSMEDWYGEDLFRGHVREPDVDDLRYIARQMRLTDVRITGRNWLGYTSRFKLVQATTRFADLPLRFFPSLCSDIYLTGHVS